MANQKMYPWLVLSVTSLGVLLTLLNFGTLNVALPVISGHFQAGAVATSWILLSFMLVNTILILIFGKLADIYGRRKMYLLGLAQFTIVSLLIGFSPNVWVLIALRALQAVGGAIVITNTTPLITDAFASKQLGMALGINVVVASISQILGPVVGGFLVYSFGWQWVFWFNVPIGIIGVVWAYFTLRREPGIAKNEKVDIVGNVTIFLGLGGLIFALSEGGVMGWSSWPVLSGLVVFIVFTVYFFRVERRVKFPTVDFALFRNRVFGMASLATFLNALSRTSVILLIALYYQVVGLDNPFEAGLKILPVTIGMMLASPLSGVLSSKYSDRGLSIVGLSITSAGIFMLLWNIGDFSTFLWMGLGQGIVGFGSGLFVTTNIKSIMLAVPADRRGIANGIRSMLQNMGSVISTALSLMIVASALPFYLKDAIYANAGAPLIGNEAELITRGYQIAFLVMLIISLLTIAAAMLQSKEDKIAAVE